MSVSAFIDICLGGRKDRIISQVILIQKLLDYGWTFDDYGQVSYLPIGDEDNSNWQSENISIEALMAILNEKEKNNEIIGVSMTWKGTDVGGNFLFIKNGEISVSLSINRKVLANDNKYIKITDVNWYLARLLPVFNQEGMLVESISYEEHV